MDITIHFIQLQPGSEVEKHKLRCTLLYPLKLRRRPDPTPATYTTYNLKLGIFRDSSCKAARMHNTSWQVIIGLRPAASFFFYYMQVMKHNFIYIYRMQAELIARRAPRTAHVLKKTFASRISHARQYRFQLMRAWQARKYGIGPNTSNLNSIRSTDRLLELKRPSSVYYVPK